MGTGSLSTGVQYLVASHAERLSLWRLRGL
jgi:hypothetical protein